MKFEKVGYRSPPSHSQYKAGQSGNPKGRPKGRRNFASELNEELSRSIQIVENGKSKKISKRQAIVKQIVNKAVSGDLKVLPTSLREVHWSEDRLSEIPANIVAAEDEAVMQSIVDRIRQSPTEPKPSRTEGYEEFATGGNVKQ